MLGYRVFTSQKTVAGIVNVKFNRTSRKLDLVLDNEVIGTVGKEANARKWSLSLPDGTTFEGAFKDKRGACQRAYELKVGQPETDAPDETEGDEPSLEEVTADFAQAESEGAGEDAPEPTPYAEPEDEPSDEPADQPARKSRRSRK